MMEMVVTTGATRRAKLQSPSGDWRFERLVAPVVTTIKLTSQANTQLISG